jgi:hypothetical protein
MLDQPTTTIVSFLLDRTGSMARAPGSNVIRIPLRCALTAEIPPLAGTLTREPVTAFETAAAAHVFFWPATLSS